MPSTGCNRVLIFSLEVIYSIWQLPSFFTAGCVRANYIMPRPFSTCEIICYTYELELIPCLVEMERPRFVSAPLFGVPRKTVDIPK